MHLKIMKKLLVEWDMQMNNKELKMKNLISKLYNLIYSVSIGEKFEKLKNAPFNPP